jgi:hypothetical protein
VPLRKCTMYVPLPYRCMFATARTLMRADRRTRTNVPSASSDVRFGSSSCASSRTGRHCGCARGSQHFDPVDLRGLDEQQTLAPQAIRVDRLEDIVERMYLECFQRMSFICSDEKTIGIESTPISSMISKAFVRPRRTSRKTTSGLCSTMAAIASPRVAHSPMNTASCRTLSSWRSPRPRKSAARLLTAPNDSCSLAP